MILLTIPQVKIRFLKDPKSSVTRAVRSADAPLIPSREGGRTMNSSRRRATLVWAITVPLFLIMVIAGFTKFTAQQNWIESFAVFGAPLWLIPVVGILEIGGAVLLFVPSFAALGALLLAVTMFVATGVNVLGGQMTPAVITLLLTTAAVTLARLRSNQSRGTEQEAEPMTAKEEYRAAREEELRAVAEEEAEPAVEPEN